MSTLVRSFEVSGRMYFHLIFISEDDRVELQDEDGAVLLIYTASSEIRAPSGRIGDFRLEGKKIVSYHGPLRTRTEYACSGVEIFLDAEVEFSKRYIRESLLKNMAAADSEGGHCD